MVNKKILKQGDELPVSSVIRVDGGVNGQFDELATAVEDLSKF